MLESSEGLHVSKVFHKTAIEVNEEGSEAAAATGMTIVVDCMPRQFNADRPFLYFIWNKKIILFAGSFLNPPVET